MSKIVEFSAPTIKLKRFMPNIPSDDGFTLASLYLNLLGDEDVAELTSDWVMVTKEDYVDGSFVYYYYKKLIQRDQFSLQLRELLLIHFHEYRIDKVLDMVFKRIENPDDPFQKVSFATVKITDSVDASIIIQLKVIAGDEGNSVEILFFYGDSGRREVVDLELIGSNKTIH